MIDIDWFISLIEHVCSITLTEDQKKTLIHQYEQRYQDELEAIAERQAEEELEAHKIKSQLSKSWDEELLKQYKTEWSISRRAVKKIDKQFYLDNNFRIPAEAIKIVKSKLPDALKKEIKNYESTEKYTITVTKK